VTGAAAMTLATGSAAKAQNWPAKPIRWVVPYTAGGLTDVVTRLTLQQMDVGQPFVVDNKPGANSLIAAEFVAKAAPDGYTFITLLPAHVANVTLYAGKLNFDPVKSFVPITLATSSPLIICTANDLPVKTVGELIAYAKKNPGRISYGSTGIGAAAHLTTELMKQVTGTDMVHVPYKGTAPALADLVSGNIQLLIDVPIGVISQIRAGKIRGLALMAKERVPGIQEIPTIVESGGPLIEASSWAMFLAPAGTPSTIVEKIAAAARRALGDETLRKRLLEQAVIPIGASPAETATFFETETRKWRQVIERAGVKVES
jgi:tripartite-type tricarboxylate transporter receptor subunit TctC